MDDQIVNVIIFAPSAICKNRRAIFGGKIKREAIDGKFKINNFDCDDCKEKEYSFVTMNVKEYFDQDPADFDTLLTTDLDLYMDVSTQETLLKILDNVDSYEEGDAEKELLSILETIGNISVMLQTLCFNKLVREYATKKWKKALEEILDELRK